MELAEESFKASPRVWQQTLALSSCHKQFSKHRNFNQEISCRVQFRIAILLGPQKSKLSKTEQSNYVTVSRQGRFGPFGAW